MANRYWVGGTAAWDGTAGTKWALTSGGAGGQTVPTSADDVFFSNLSTGTCTISTGNTGAKSINCTGFTGTLTGTGAITVSGSITLVAGMVYSYTGSLTINGTGTLTSAGKTLGTTTINGSGITVTLGDAVTVNGPLTLTTGTFTTNNFNVTAYNFSSSGVLVRTLNMGSSTWTLSAQYSGPDHWTVTVSTNLTLNAGTSTINCTYIGGGANSFFRGGDLTYYNLKNSNASPSALTLSGSNTFNDLVNGNTTQDSYFVFSAGTTQTFTNFTYSNTAPHTTNFKSTVSGSTFTLSKASGTVNLSRMTIKDSVASGGATWNATDSLDLGNNTGWNFTAPTGRYWVGGTASWDGTAGTKWALTSGGAGGATIPGLVDPVYFNAASGANTVTIATGNIGCAGFVCTGFTGTLTGTAALSVYGNVTLVSGMTYTYTGTITFAGTATVTSAGKTFGNVTISNAGMTVTLADYLTTGITNTLTLTQGTLDLSIGAASVGIFSSSGALTRSIVFGNQNIELTSTTAGATVLNMATATNFSWTGTGGFERNQAATATVAFGSTSGGSTTNAPNLRVYAGASALTSTTGSYFKKLDFSGSGCTVTASLLNMAGDLVLGGGTYTAVVPTFRATAIIDCAGKTLGNTTINGTGITVTLAATMTVGITNTTTLTAGTINLAGNQLSTGIFSSSGSTTRAIDFNGNIALTSATALATVLLMTTATGFTWTGTGGFTRNMGNSATMVFGTTGGTTTNAPNLTVSAGSSALTITAASWFKNVIFTGNASTVTASNLNMAGDLTLASGGTYTAFNVTFRAPATITSVGKALQSAGIDAAGSTVTLNGALTQSSTFYFTLTQGGLDLAGFTLSAGGFSSNNSNTRAISFGTGNIALTSTLASTSVLVMADATNFSWDGIGGFTRGNFINGGSSVTFGTTGGTTLNAPDLTVNAGSLGFIITAGSWFRNVNFTGSTSFITGTNLNMAGDLTLASGGTYTSLNPTFRTTAYATSAGKTLSGFGVNGSGITVYLNDALTVGITGTTTLTEGTFWASNNAVTTGFFSSSNSNTRVLEMGVGTWTITGSGASAWNTANATGLTFNTVDATISMTSASAKTFAGGGLTYYNLNQGGAGALTISGSNTFNNITNSTQPATVTFTAGTTQTVSNFGLSGTAGNLVTIASSTPGSQFTLSKASGQVVAQYLSIQDSNATGGASWIARESTNVSNNTGWNFINNSPDMLTMFT